MNQPAKKKSGNLLCLGKSVVLKMYQGRDQNREKKIVREILVVKAWQGKTKKGRQMSMENKE